MDDAADADPEATVVDDKLDPLEPDEEEDVDDTADDAAGDRDDVENEQDDSDDGSVAGKLRHSGPDAVVECATTAGPFTAHLYRAWSPNGYDRAAALFERGYYDRSHFFRVVPDFLVQFGISYTTDAELKEFADRTIPDDPKRDGLMPFRAGYMSFAGSGPNSRTSQLFIAYDGASGLGQSPWETPFGEVVHGMDNVQKLYSYGDQPPWGKGPEQGPIRNRGSSYIEENFPLLDKFQTCTVREMDSSPGEKKDKVKVGYTAMRGGVKNVDSKTPPRKMRDDSVTEKQFPLYGKIAIMAIVLVALVQLVRRKKGKQSGKSV